MRAIALGTAIGLIAAVAVGVRWLSGDPEIRPGLVSAPVQTAPPPPARVAVPPPAEPPPSADAPPANALPPLEISAKFVGVVGSSALFEAPDGERRRVSVGEPVEPEVWLTEIRRTSVIVTDALDRSRELALTGGSGTPDAQSPGPDFFAMDRLELEALGRGDPPRLMVDLGSALRDLEQTIQLSVDERGAVSVDELRRGSPLARLGLRPGDRIVTVDGTEINSIRGGMDSLARSLYSEGGSTVLGVERFDGSFVQIAVAAGAALRSPPPETP